MGRRTAPDVTPTPPALGLATKAVRQPPCPDAFSATLLSSHAPDPCLRSEMAFDKETVVIIGAGASASYGLPVGSRLVADIASGEWDASGLGDLAKDLVSLAYDDENFDDMDEAGEFFRAFSAQCGHAGAPSIDTFLNARSSEPHLVRLGKKLIAAYLIAAERRNLRTARSFNGIYEWLFRRCSPLGGWAGAGRSSPDFTKLSIVTFNYDRILELRFDAMWHAYTGQARASDREIEELALPPLFVHAYGKLESSFERVNPGTLLVPRLTPGAVRDSAQRIAIASDRPGCSDPPREANPQPQTVRTARGWLSRAEQVVFLGFGFDDFNMGQLGFGPLAQFPVQLPKTTQVFATVRGKNARERETIGKWLGCSMDNFLDGDAHSALHEWSLE